jgi:hypothetical protein
LKRHIVIIYILLMATSSAFSQDEYITTGMRDLIGQVDWIKRTQPGTSTIEGSPYLNDDFIDGTIYYDKKYKIDKVPLRLNLYNGDMEFKEKNTTMAIADPSRINKIVMGAYTFIYLPENKKEKVGGFVRMWNPKLPSIITKMKIDFLKKSPAKPYADPMPDRFETGQDKHYLLTSTHEIEKITSVKKLIQALGDHESELSVYAKTEKISSGNIEELVKLMEYYHSLEK